MNRKLFVSIICTLSILLAILFPMLSIPVSLAGLVFTKGKMRKMYGFLLAFSFSMIAYMWNPDTTMDLYRHHEQVQLFSSFNVNQLGNIIQSELEPMNYLIKFFVAQTGNVDLLQLFVILCGFSELLWMICDFAEIKKMKKIPFILLFIYGVTAVRFVDFASGLWCNFAIINMALGVYLQYFKKAKYTQYILYLLSACLHIGSVYVVALVVLFSKVRIFKKVRWPILLTTFICLLSFGGIVMLLNELFGADSSLMIIVNRMYKGYFINGNQFDSLHTGWNLILPVTTMLLGLMLSARPFKNETTNEYRSLVMYLIVCLLASIINAGVFVRFGFLVSILLIPVIYEYIEGERKGKITSLLIMSGLLVLIAAQADRSFSQMQSAGMMQEIEENANSSSVEIIDTQGGW